MKKGQRGGEFYLDEYSQGGGNRTKGDLENMTVKEIRIALGLALALTFCGSAALANNCATAPMSVYTVTGFSCNVGDLVFSNFAYSSSQSAGGYAPPASGVIVTPITQAGKSGFQFSGAFLASPSQKVGGIIAYKVTSQGPSLGSWLLSLVAGAGGTGSASAVEVQPSGGSLSTYVGGGTKVFSNTAALSTGEATVSVTLAVSGGKGGVAALLAVDTLWS